MKPTSHTFTYPARDGTIKTARVSFAIMPSFPWALVVLSGTGNMAAYFKTRKDARRYSHSPQMPDGATFVIGRVE